MGDGGGGSEVLDAAVRPPVGPRPAARPTERLVVLAVLVALSVAPLVAAGLLLHRGWQPIGDRAIIALRSTDVPHGRAPQLGQPTTGDRYGPAESFHPGPAQFWLLAPFTAALGPRAGAAVGTAALSGAAVATALLLARRGGGTALFGLLAAGVALTSWSLGGSHLVDPMNSELVAVLLLATAVAAWAVLIGDARAVPVFVAWATVLAQVHVTGAAYAVPLVLVAAVGVARHGRDGAWRRGAASWSGLALGIAVVAWLPPVAYEVGSRPSNVGALWRTLGAGEPTAGYRMALERLVSSLGPRPLFLGGPGWRVGLGPRPWPVVLGVGAALGVLGSLAVVHRRRHHPTVTALAAVVATLVVSVVVVIGRTPRVDALRADVSRPLSTVAVLVWVGVAWLAWCRLPLARRRAGEPWLVRVAAGVVVVAVVGMLATSTEPDPARDGDLMPLAQEVQDELVARVPDGRYRIDVDGSEAYLTFLPGIVARLEQAGIRCYVNLGPFSRAYGAYREFDGQPVDGALVVRTDHVAGRATLDGIGGGERAPQPGGRPIAAARADGVALQVYLEGA